MSKKIFPPLERKKINKFLSLAGFTLLELIIVVIIVGVLATLGMVNLSSFKEKTLEKEVKSGLSLIRAAEKIYHMETNSYYPSSGTVATSSINNVLKLALSTNNWSYSVSAGFTACGQRVLDSSNCWCITNSTESAYSCDCSSSACSP
jgi:prepilin-type N-terminal cleavage/methylation domain-containing protein